MLGIDQKALTNLFNNNNAKINSIQPAGTHRIAQTTGYSINSAKRLELIFDPN